MGEKFGVDSRLEMMLLARILLMLLLVKVNFSKQLSETLLGFDSSILL